MVVVGRAFSSFKLLALDDSLMIALLFASSSCMLHARRRTFGSDSLAPSSSVPSDPGGLFPVRSLFVDDCAGGEKGAELPPREW